MLLLLDQIMLHHGAAVPPTCSAPPPSEAWEEEVTMGGFPLPVCVIHPATKQHKGPLTADSCQTSQGP